MLFSLFRWGHHTALGSWCALVGRHYSAEGRFCGEENETAQHLWVWCSAFKEERWRAWFGESLWELVETPLRASELLRAILRCLKWSTTKTAPPRQYLPLRGRHNMLFMQRLVSSCLYICSTYKFDSICNILSLRALLGDQLSAFNASHRVHNKPYDHRLHKGISQSDSTECHSLRQWSSSFRWLSSGLLSIAALHVLKHSTTSFTGWRLRQYLSYTCSCNWYMNGKFFTTEWKQEIKFSFRKMSKLNFDLYFDLCRSVEFTLVSSISILH